MTEQSVVHVVLVPVEMAAGMKDQEGQEKQKGPRRL
jgi:hypothetical protein